MALGGLSLILIGCKLSYFQERLIPCSLLPSLQGQGVGGGRGDGGMGGADPVSDSYSLPSSGICRNEMANLGNSAEEIPKTLASVCLVETITLNGEK